MQFTRKILLHVFNPFRRRAFEHTSLKCWLWSNACSSFYADLTIWLLKYLPTQSDGAAAPLRVSHWHLERCITPREASFLSLANPVEIDGLVRPPSY